MAGDEWISGSWEGREGVAAYRSEWLGETLVERITFCDGGLSLYNSLLPAPECCREGLLDLVRFWLFASDQIVDKAFDSGAEPFAYYSPVTQPLVRTGDGASASHLWLGLRMDKNRRVAVTGEADFEAAVAQGLLTPQEVAHGEQRIRQLTASAAAKRWPPPFVRNFAIVKEAND